MHTAFTRNCLRCMVIIDMQTCVHATAGQHLHQSLGQVSNAAVPAVRSIDGDGTGRTQRHLFGPGTCPTDGLYSSTVLPLTLVK